MLNPLLTEKMSPASPPDSGLRHRLRAATRPEHESLDEVMSTLDLHEPASYTTFLHIQSIALDALIPLAAAADSEDFLALRQRLADDLQRQCEAGLPPAVVRSKGLAASPMFCDAVSPALQWGLAYVIRGSRLGSRLLSARVAPGLPRSYFDFRPSISWPHFLMTLESASAGFDADDHLHAEAGAKFAFAAYATTARGLLMNS